MARLLHITGITSIVPAANAVLTLMPCGTEHSKAPVTDTAR